MKKRTTTQKNHLIFRLADTEKRFVTWRKTTWNKTKFYFDVIHGIFDFYQTKVNNYLGDSLKNPRVREQNNEIKALNSIWRHMKMCHVKITQRNKRNKLIYSPSSSRDISFNQNLVSKFGVSQE